MKRKTYDTLGRRILAVLEPECGGPRKLNVLRGMADPKRVDRTLARLVRNRQVVRRGERRGLTFALAPRRPVT